VDHFYIVIKKIIDMMIIAINAEYVLYSFWGSNIWFWKDQFR
jgi:hypothetical protein